MNLEWRQRLFGSLYGAISLDAGNVWSLEHLKSADNASDEELAALATADSQMHFDFKDLFSELAVATGVGIRYDLDFLIIRLDWGVGLHVPYETSRSGFFNVDKFKDHQTWHFSIGYPF
jgi:outer membrane translocation and assembly module TamA